MSWSEMQVRKRLVREWINRVPPLEIILHRPVQGSDGAGGVVPTSETVLDPQLFGFMPFKRRLTIEKTTDSQNLGANETSYIYYVLIGQPGVHDILKHDYFTWVGNELLQGGVYDVAFVQSRNHDHLQAGILYRGPG